MNHYSETITGNDLYILEMEENKIKDSKIKNEILLIPPMIEVFDKQIRIYGKFANNIAWLIKELMEEDCDVEMYCYYNNVFIVDFNSDILSDEEIKDILSPKLQIAFCMICGVIEHMLDAA